MSSMRNSIQRRSHRERGQLKEREKFGLLEKHKDYSLRAKDHKKKQTVLKSLKQKAAERNEDEFYFGMMSRGFSSGKFAGGKKWTGTVAGDRGNKALDIDTVRLLKTQDLGYLRTMRNVVSKEVAELEQKVTIAGAFAGVDPNEEEEDGFDSEEDEAPRKAKPQPKSKKIVFADSPEELESKLPEQDDDADMDEDDFENFDEELSPEAKKKALNAERLRRKLRHAKKKLKALTDAESELEMQRARMAKTATVGGTTKKGKTFKIRERKR
ncbi:putative U3 small nucleolar RNA-associated protein 11 [Cytospora mali]|uniref:U3 small nucleolar RNA-associated protein 11 n=1 Tax=Cytospora mali TaxID=578113 RepID=A0A194V9B9_CYTMA|nr:putative U3 small nucleolar RNA-associated protein 11 [Valsa mali var. pyri (nom. inval.)]